MSRSTYMLAVAHGAIFIQMLFQGIKVAIDNNTPVVGESCTAAVRK